MDRRAYYQESFAKYGVSPLSLKYNSKKSAEIRYKEIVADLDFGDKNILDVGCGFADITRFIRKKSKTFNYTGVDITPEFINTDKIKFPQYSFVCRDYFTRPLTQKFDIVISSGVLNANFKKNVSYRKKALKLLFKHAKEALVFNMAGIYPKPKNKKNGKIYYSDPMKILKYCLSLTEKVIFRDNYGLKDFTIVMFK